MASFVYNSYKGYLLSGYAIRLITDPIYVALMTSTLTPDMNGLTQKVFADVSGYQPAGDQGYSISGKRVQTPVVTVTTGNGNNYATFSSSTDITWTGSTITASGAVIYASGAYGSPTVTAPLLAYIDFGSSLSSSNGDFTIQFAAAGILRISNG